MSGFDFVEESLRGVPLRLRDLRGGVPILPSGKKVVLQRWMRGGALLMGLVFGSSGQARG
ncbi:hypothetical protein ASE36_17550 [Rhizobium sp. Root274]|nr:hypothetical protein ASC71_17580 [Rhizobium sp. Root1240]KRD27654.1 hypothetical protein ASE36_17550 [Rhizobium sp. Root274]